MELNWSKINKVGNSKILKTSYYWLIIIPLFAKLLSGIKDILTFNIFGVEVIIRFSLPFSWQLFYISALLIAIADIIYTYKCPELIKEFKDYNSYQMSGRTALQLRHYALSYTLNETNVMNATRSSLPSDQKELLNQEIYWNLYEYLDALFPKTRLISIGLYALGFILLGIVFYQNMLFVFNQLV